MFRNLYDRGVTWFRSGQTRITWIVTILAAILLGVFWLYDYIDEGRLLIYALHAIGYAILACVLIVLFIRRRSFALDIQPSGSAQGAGKYTLWIVLIVLLVGLGLRVLSFTWNVWRFGDVNLFALTAREFVLHGKLQYPMAYGPPELINWQTLTAPATQHPILLPWLGGVLALAMNTTDTFLALKVLCEIGGMVLLLVLLLNARQPDWHQPMLLAALLCAASPLLVDFSANGSSYIFSALVLVAVCLVLARFDYEKLAHYLLVGLLCGLGQQTHSVLIVLPAAVVVFWWADQRKFNWRGVALFAAAMIVSMIPWLVWNVQNTGSLFYSSSTNYVLEKLGISSFSEVGAREIFRYINFIKGTLHTFLREIQLEIGPGALWLSALGIYGLWRQNRRLALALLIPLAAYAVPTLVWPLFKQRFLVPYIPVVYILAAFGFTIFNRSGPRALVTVNRVAVVVAVLWPIASFFDKPPTQYFEPAEEANLISEMTQSETLSSHLAGLPPGTVLDLSGGRAIQGLYSYSYPLITGEGPYSAGEVQDMVLTYKVRYIWADTTSDALVHTAFPQAVPVFQDKTQSIYQLP